MRFLSIIQRWWHRHGFGVQSPWAYEFVTDALYDQHRYYAFDTLKGSNSDEQLFRICLWLRPRHLLCAGEKDSAVEHINAAYRTLDDKQKSDLTILYFAADRTGEISKAFQGGWIDEKTCIIIEGIRNKETRSLWQSLVDSPLTTSTFDLGDRGILFFNKERQKQNYLL